MVRRRKPPAATKGSISACGCRLGGCFAPGHLCAERCQLPEDGWLFSQLIIYNKSTRSNCMAMFEAFLPASLECFLVGAFAKVLGKGREQSHVGLFVCFA